MTYSLTSVISAVQSLSTDLLAAEGFISAFSHIWLFTTITSNFFDNFTARTRASMANFFTVMFTAILCLVTNFLAGESSRFITASCFHLLASTEATLFFSHSSTRRTGAGMASQRTRMNTVCTTEFTASITARMGSIIRIKFRVSFFTAEAFIIRHGFSVIVVTLRTSPVEELEAWNHFAVLEVGRILKNPFLQAR